MDLFPHYFLYAAAAEMTMIIHKSFLPLELLWSYSQWLEAFAILPQLMMISKIKNV
jgi:ER lumen protein retaining receptor